MSGLGACKYSFGQCFPDGPCDDCTDPDTDRLELLDGKQADEILASTWLANRSREEPRIEVQSYVIYPTGYDDMVHSDKFTWCLEVTNGHEWGWSVRQAGYGGSRAMNRRGEWIYEQRGSGHNKARRWTIDEALAIAAAHVDTHRINGHTAAEASASIAVRLAALPPHLAGGGWGARNQ